MSLLSPFPNEVYRKDPEHQYYHNDGTPYISVSKFLEKFSKPFDGKMMSLGTAKNQLAKMGIKQTREMISAQQMQVQAGWDANRDAAADRGTKFHLAMETYLGSGTITVPEWADAIRMVAELFSAYYRNYTEVIAYSTEHRVAGTIDVPSLHSFKQKDLIHIKDFKTNAKGIHNEMEYNKWMYEPIAHLIDNKYTRYALQQSIYGYFLETHGYRVGSLNLIWIDMERLGEKGFAQQIPIPYLRNEVKAMLDHYKQSQQYPLTQEECYQKDDDDVTF